MKIVHGEIFHYMNEVVFFVLVAGGLFFIMELAFRYGRHRARAAKEDFSPQAGSFGTTLLGLLALLLGFAFAMALGRFDTRKDLLLQERNDIHTAYLRTDMLPVECRTDVKRLLGDYTALRVDYYRPGTLAADMDAIVDETVAVQMKLWDATMTALEQHPEEQSKIMSFKAALNEVFADQTKRTIARGDHIPEAILWLLIFVAACALATTAYSLGLKNAYFFLPPPGAGAGGYRSLEHHSGFGPSHPRYDTNRPA